MKIFEVSGVGDIYHYCNQPQFENNSCYTCEIFKVCYQNNKLILDGQERFEEIQKFNRRRKLEKLLS